MTKMPKVIGMKFEEAENELKNSNLQIEKIDKISKTVEKGNSNRARSSRGNRTKIRRKK